MRRDNYLVISDTQIPFQHRRALKFCQEIKKEFKVSDDNILHVGDEVDQYFGSLYDKDPDATHTPSSEVFQSIKILKEWYSVFPKMRLAESNHGQRWAKKAAHSGIPSIFMRKYQEVLQAPLSWVWQKKWLIRAWKKPFLLVHGVGYSGAAAHRQMAIHNGMNTVHGHLHSHAGTAVITTDGLENVWGMNVGCLINREAYAFRYGEDSKFKPCIGVGVVLDGGRTPIWIPY